MKPYIEYKGNFYEFEANFDLERKFNKEVQNTYKNQIVANNITESEIKEASGLVEKAKSLSEEELENNPELKEKIEKLNNKFSNINVSDLYEKYCYEMLKTKYGISRETWDDMLKQYVDDYCDNVSELDLLFAKVIEKVFTQKAEKTKKPLPNWMTE